MKKVILLIIALFLVVPAIAEDGDCEYLARIVANEMRDEPFIVKVAFCEMLVNQTENDPFPPTLPAVAHTLGLSRAKTATEADMYAAVIALERLCFFKDIFYCKKWSEVKNTPLEKTNGVHLYDWYFYSTGSM